MAVRIICSTTFDITATGVRSHYKPSRMPFVDQAGKNVVNQHDWNRSRNQQRNWETLNQLISMRTLPQEISFPSCDRNRQPIIWCFSFEVSDTASLGTEEDPVAFLKKDAEGVPMIVGLEESPCKQSVICTTHPNHNVWFAFEIINNFSQGTEPDG